MNADKYPKSSQEALPEVEQMVRDTEEYLKAIPAEFKEDELSGYELQNVLEYPRTVKNYHESLYQSYHLLNIVIKMLKNNDKRSTILAFVDMVKLNNRNRK